MLHITNVLAFAGFFLVALFSPVASAQSTISGQAKDSSGAVMAGVGVEAASPALIERSRAVITNGEGRYAIVDIRPGPYTVTFTKPGFSAVREEIEVPANVTVPVGGPLLFILNSEIRFPLFIHRNLGGVVFYDGGNVFSAINLPNFVNNYTNTVGFGLRYSTPIGPVRFDIGHNLNPIPGINPTQYYITIGQAF